MTNARQDIVVAIDGPAGAGKSSVAKAVAARLGLVRLDTGAMYRAVTMTALREGTDLEDGDALGSLAESLDLTFDGSGIHIDGVSAEREIRTPAVNAAVSAVARHPQVRRVLVARQQDLAKTGGAVIEGRDIGSVVAPHAQVKVFLTASPAERARRRHEEMLASGHDVDEAELRREIEARDARDHRTTPLEPAAGAATIDSTGKTIDQVVDEIEAIALRAGWSA